MYKKGKGVDRNYDQAAHWYKAAAKNGHLGAQKKLKELKE